MALGALHGVNLTGWLTLESWVTPALFAPHGALDEPTLIRNLGRKEYRELVNKHRASFISEDDFKRIASRGFNAVRLAVPWYVFGDAGPTPGPYVGCLDYVDAALDWAEDIGLKLIFALAISPGATPIDGASSYYFSDLRSYRERALTVIAALSKRYANRIGFAGIELADDVHPQVRKGLSLSDGVAAHVLRNYYRDAYEIVRTSAGEDPIVIMPDGGYPGLLRRFMTTEHYTNVWTDCDIMATTNKLDSTAPRGMKAVSDAIRHHLSDAKRARFPIMVGRWSANMPYASSLMTPEGRVALERLYVSEQLGLYENCAAWFFQTWKTTGLLANWDARVALATFERGLIV